MIRRFINRISSRKLLYFIEAILEIDQHLGLIDRMKRNLNKEEQVIMNLSMMPMHWIGLMEMCGKGGLPLRCKQETKLTTVKPSNHADLPTL